jgi:ABC-type glycerol-3-phosphate transport system substrate-binding protein
MKKTLIALILIFALALTACGTGAESTSPAAHTAAPLSLDQSTGQWTGRGGSYKAELANVSQDVTRYTRCGEHEYSIVDHYALDDFTHFYRDGQEIGQSPDYVLWYQAAENGLWVLSQDYEEGSTSLSFFSLSGAEDFTAALNDGRPIYRSTVAAELVNEKLYVLYDCNELLAFDKAGQLVTDVPLDQAFNDLVQASNGQLYALNQSEAWLLNESGASFAFSFEDGQVFSGAYNDYLLFAAADGLYSMSSDGSIEPIVIWDECYLSFNNIFNVMPIDDEAYLVTDASGYVGYFGTYSYYRLYPASAEEVHPKVGLKLVSLSYDNLSSYIARFNSTNPNYYINYVNYMYDSYGNFYDTDEIIQRLNTEIISGNVPDMICFSRGAAPERYAAKGILADMKPMIESDPDISLDDIVLAKALETDGSIYLMDNTFILPTLEGKVENFANPWGWTLSEYKQLDSRFSDNQMTIYNITKDQFLRQLAIRYIRQAVDWEQGSCDFDNDTFKEILQYTLDLRETPEDLDNMVFGGSTARVAAGEQGTNAVFGTAVYPFDQSERSAGCEMSFIGWPTVDGSCGTDAYLDNAVGICNTGNQQACFEFVKFMLTSVDTDDEPLCMYAPKLEEAISKAIAEEKMNRQDAQKLWEFIAQIDSAEFYDETIMNIIQTQCQALFSGDKTVDETAKLIQSKVSLYVSEQS